MKIVAVLLLLTSDRRSWKRMRCSSIWRRIQPNGSAAPLQPTGITPDHGKSPGNPLKLHP
jgi:hypothetical protein